jgi:hypothetical protein
MGFSGQNTGVEEMCREQCSWVHCTQRTMLMGSLHKLFQINPRRMDHSNYGELFLHDFDFDLIGGIVGLFAIHPHSDLLSSSWKSLSLSLCKAYQNPNFIVNTKMETKRKLRRITCHCYLLFILGRTIITCLSVTLPFPSRFLNVSLLLLATSVGFFNTTIKVD